MTNVLKLMTAMLFFFMVSVLGAQTIQIRIATVAPEKSPYGNALRKMSGEWERISGGKVKMIPYFGDKLGDEESIVQKIRSNNLQGAMLTLAGLSYIDKPLITVSAPLLIENDKQLAYVLETLAPEIDKRLAANGFIGIAYSPAGWINFFAKTKFELPSDLRQLKLGISNKSKEIYAAFQAMNYRVVNVDVAETTANLLTNRAEAIFTSPLIAGAYNWVGIARYMLNFRISPFFGGLIINDRTWNRIDPSLQKQLLESARNVAEKELANALEKLEADGIKAMVAASGGLILVNITDVQKAVWRTELEAGLQSTLGSAFDSDMYNRIKSILADFKKKNK